MTIQQILDEVAELEREITDLPSGAGELPEIQGRISGLLAEVERLRSLQGALVPDASSPETLAEKSVDELEAALRSLRSAATSKGQTPVSTAAP
jgi:hypothetical protein